MRLQIFHLDNIARPGFQNSHGDNFSPRIKHTGHAHFTSQNGFYQRNDFLGDDHHIFGF